jgi:phospholipase A1/A2
MSRTILKKLAVFVGFSLILNAHEVCASTETAVQQRENLQSQESKNPFVISLYEPNYIMPFAYTSSWNKAAELEDDELDNLNHIETKFQLSIKTAIWKNFFNYKNSLNLAYTQLSFWQLYSHTPYFRETNYQPEIFFSGSIEKKLVGGWNLSFINIGAIHESNGRGGSNERSWNRAYAEVIFSNANWLLSIRPWYVIPGNSLENNPNISSYLGHERLILSYKFHQQTFSILTYNLERLTTRASVEATWSFPLIRQLHGYVQGFSGYGQSLIEYDHRTNSVSVGIALNDWI